MVLSAQLLVLCGLPEVHNGTTAEPALGDYLMRWPDELVSGYAQGAVHAASPSQNAHTTRFGSFSGVVRTG